MPAETQSTALSLEGFRRVMGFHPWHFWGMADQDVLRVTADCPSVVKQYAWQQVDAVGRNEIVDAIASAERLLREYLGYRPGAVYTEATMPWPQLGDRRMVRWGAADPQGHWLSVALPEAELQAVGVESRTLIGTAAVSYTDPNGDGVNELATITIATSVTDADTIAVYVPAIDRLYSEPVSEAYRIRPLRATISGGVATIRGPSYLFVRPERYETVSPEASDADLDPADAGVLLAAAEVYQRTTSASGTTTATSQGVVIWETRPCHGWWCGCGCQASAAQGSPFDPAAVAQAVARVGIRDAGRGVVIPAEAVYNATTATWAAYPSACWPPDRVTVRYLAGLPLVNGDMRADWATVTARLAAAELARPICACQTANREIDRWQFDAAIASEAESYSLSPEDLNCPWGTRRGHIQAWRWVQRRERLRAYTE